jgi:hypothetical protein
MCPFPCVISTKRTVHSIFTNYYRVNLCTNELTSTPIGTKFTSPAQFFDGLSVESPLSA